MSNTSIPKAVTAKYGKLKHWKLKEIPTQIGMTSLVGIMNKSYPVGYGNYCSVGHYGSGQEHYLINLWAENLEHLQTKGKALSGVTKMLALVQVTGGQAIVVDPRIPKDYLNKEPCFTGGGGGYTTESYRELYQVMRPQWKPEEGCGCTEEQDYFSVFFHRWGGNQKHGRCRLCAKELVIDTPPVQQAGIVFAPYIPQTTTTEIMVDASVDQEKEFQIMWDALTPERQKELEERYSKPINPNFYGTITLGATSGSQAEADGGQNPIGLPGGEETPA